MKYACLVYFENTIWDNISPTDSDLLSRESFAYDQELEKSGRLIGAQALQPVQTATTVRVRNGKLSATDGPFAETKEVLGGFLLVNARDLDEAIQIASKIPLARLGSVEVRPIKEKGVEPAGAPFWRYLIVDMERALEIDVAVPVAAALPGDGRVIADVLPAGRYVTALHTGHPDELERATADLLAWAEKHGITWKMNGHTWDGRVEWYLSDPQVEPDMHKWRTELAFLTEEA